jgi:hypothetical protein
MWHLVPCANAVSVPYKKLDAIWGAKSNSFRWPVKLCQAVAPFRASAFRGSFAEALFVCRLQRHSVDSVRSEGRLSHPLSPALSVTGTSTDQRQHSPADRLGSAGQASTTRASSGDDSNALVKARSRPREELPEVFTAKELAQAPKRFRFSLSRFESWRGSFQLQLSVRAILSEVAEPAEQFRKGLP